MCCAGTVPISVWVLPSSSPKRGAPSRTHRASFPHVLVYGTGVPVEPEVNTIAAACVTGIRGMSRAA